MTGANLDAVDHVIARAAFHDTHLNLAAELAVQAQESGADAVLRTLSSLNLSDLPPLIAAMSMLVRLDLPFAGGDDEVPYCSKGRHPMNVANGRVERSGARRCRACDRDRMRLARARAQGGAPDDGS